MTCATPRGGNVRCARHDGFFASTYCARWRQMVVAVAERIRHLGKWAVAPRPTCHSSFSAVAGYVRCRTDACRAAAYKEVSGRRAWLEETTAATDHRPERKETKHVLSGSCHEHDERRLVALRNVGGRVLSGVGPKPTAQKTRAKCAVRVVASSIGQSRADTDRRTDREVGAERNGDDTAKAGHRTARAWQRRNICRGVWGDAAHSSNRSPDLHAPATRLDPASTLTEAAAAALRSRPISESTIHVSNQR
jgi:hypothetical protein